MGEPVVAASYNGDKMGETAASVSALNVSVSFGRFENDSLSWERWSSFSPNKYLEEVEKCATPGSVAQKKAYFEAHYKKIAARKAELMDQEKQLEHDILGSNFNDQNNGDLRDRTCEEDAECDLYNGHVSVEEDAQDCKLDSESSNNHVVEPTEGQDSVVARAKEEIGSKLGSLTLKEPQVAVFVREEERSNENEESDSRVGSPMLIKPEESALVKEKETPSLLSRDNKKDLPKKMNKSMERIPITKEEKLKLGQRKEPPKNTLVSKVGDIARVKKKPVSPVTKVPQMSTPGVSKPMATSTTLSASRSSTKKMTGSLLLRSKNPPAEESKKVAPKSLHMSLNLEPTNPVLAPPSPLAATRKSFIMEKMGDKDIVKRAFKTFQNNYNQLKASAEERSFRAKQAPAKGTEVKVSNSTTPRKENGGSLKPMVVDRKTSKPAPSSFGFKRDERAEKRKEFSKKLEEKSSVKDTETIHTKSKEEKVTDIKSQRKSLNPKAMPIPGFYHGQKASRCPFDKEGSKTLRI